MKMEQTEGSEMDNLKPTHSSYLPAYEDGTDRALWKV